MSIDSMEELLVEELKDLYDAEKQLVKALPKLAKAASDQELSAAFQHHLDQTKGHVQRLEEVFGILGEKPKSKLCKGMKGLVEEGVDVMHEDTSGTLADEAIISAAQKVEHYEIAGYGSARTLAQAIGKKDAVQLLQETLNEEGEADKKLTQIAKRLIKESNGGTAKRASSGGKKAAASSGKGNGSKSTRSNRGGGEHGAKTTTDHEEIRRWAEERGAEPACVKGTGGKGDIGMLRLDFPGYSGADSLEHISWDDFFEKFDERGLALLHQDETTAGEKSNFNKLVSRK
jgi:ferritin-like metal-binding protein YciE